MDYEKKLQEKAKKEDDDMFGRLGLDDMAGGEYEFGKGVKEVKEHGKEALKKDSKNS